MDISIEHFNSKVNISEKDAYDSSVSMDDDGRFFLDNNGKFVEFSGRIVTKYEELTFKDGFAHSYDDYPSTKNIDYEHWAKDGFAHRTKGPVFIFRGKIYKWAIEGQYYPFKIFLSMLNEEDRIEVILKYGHISLE